MCWVRRYPNSELGYHLIICILHPFRFNLFVWQWWRFLIPWNDSYCQFFSGTVFITRWCCAVVPEPYTCFTEKLSVIGNLQIGNLAHRSVVWNIGAWSKIQVYFRFWFKDLIMSKKTRRLYSVYVKKNPLFLLYGKSWKD